MKCLQFIWVGLIAFCAVNLQSAEMPLLEKKQRPQIDTQQANALIHWARDYLPQKGVLKEQKDGYVYLKVDDDYINKLYPLLNYPGYIIPPYFRRPDSPGAHISVMYVDERSRTGRINEIGQVFTFALTDLVFVPSKSQKYIALEINAPKLEELRKKYGLSPFLKGHHFHITIAKKDLKR